jgi:hypothetical protein
MMTLVASLLTIADTKPIESSEVVWLSGILWFQMVS